MIADSTANWDDTLTSVSPENYSTCDMEFMRLLPKYFLCIFHLSFILSLDLIFLSSLALSSLSDACLSLAN